LRTRRFLVALAVAGAGLVPARPAQAAPLTPAQAVKAFAPVVRLHPDERWFPVNPSTFIGGSSLRFDRSMWRDHSEAGRGEIDAARLGSGGYERNGRKSNDPNARQRGGWFLRLEDDALKAGTGTSADGLYRIVPGRFLTYWFFYAYSDSEGKINHEGDWERITIQLNKQNRPVRVAFHGHGGHCLSEWSTVDKLSGTHPVVYSSLGDHASFPRPGTRKMWKGAATDKWADGGRQWDLSQRTLHDVTTRPWYGYTGAWGDLGVDLGPRGGDTSGPQGPVMKPAKAEQFAGTVEGCGADGA
jgi:hypothetical protein